MKKLLLLAVFLPMALCCHSQSKDDPAFIFGLLGGPDITTGVLQERAIILASPALFNGTADSLSQYYGWQQLYTQFYNGSLSQSSLLHPDTLHSVLRGSFYEEVPLLFTHYRYNALLPDAEDLGLIAFDSASGRYHDVPNRSQSPYTEGQVFSLALPVRKWNDSTGITYRISEDYWFGNVPAPATPAAILALMG